MVIYTTYNIHQTKSAARTRESPSFLLAQYHRLPCNIMQYHAISCNIKTREGLKRSELTICSYIFLLFFFVIYFSAMELRKKHVVGKDEFSKWRSSVPKCSKNFLWNRQEESRAVGMKKCKYQPFVPGMPQYSENQDVDVDAGAAESPGSLSLSTSAATRKKEFAQSLKKYNYILSLVVLKSGPSFDPSFGGVATPPSKAGSQPARDAQNENAEI